MAELKNPAHAASAIALTFKEQRRLWFRELLTRAGARDAETLATQLMLLVDGAIAAALVRNDPSMALAARDAARVLMVADGADVPEAVPLSS